MSRLFLALPVLALLAACGTDGDAQLATAPQRLTCAEIGVAPDDDGFDRCVADQTLVDQQVLSER